MLPTIEVRDEVLFLVAAGSMLGERGEKVFVGSAFACFRGGKYAIFSFPKGAEILDADPLGNKVATRLARTLGVGYVGNTCRYRVLKGACRRSLGVRAGRLKVSPRATATLDATT